MSDEEQKAEERNIGNRPPLPTDAVAGATGHIDAHNRLIYAIQDLRSVQDEKADADHSHAISNVAGLQTALDGKSPTAHTHAQYLDPNKIVAGVNISVDRTTLPGSVVINSQDGGSGVDDGLYLSPTEIIAGNNISVDRSTTPGSVIISATGGSVGGQSPRRGEVLVTWAGGAWHCNGETVAVRPTTLPYADGERVVWDTSMDSSFTSPPLLAQPGDVWLPYSGTDPSASVIQPLYTPAKAGAEIPLSYDIGSLPGTVRYLAPGGQKLQQLVDASAPGDTVVVQAGTYRAADHAASISKRLTITAAPGASPVFDGSRSATGMTTDGLLKKFPYTPMPAKSDAEGIGFRTSDSPYPLAFDGSNLTPLAQERGWARTNTNGTYTIPVDQATKPADNMAHVITGMYPDQVWVNGVLLTQVLLKSKVKKGFFFVDRGTNDDPTVATDLYLHQDELSDWSNYTNSVRFSEAGGAQNFLYVNADDVTIRGLKIFGYSPRLSHFTVGTGVGISRLLLEDMVFDSCSGITVKLFGDASTSGGNPLFDGTRLQRNMTLRRCTFLNCGWMGMSAQYGDDTLVTRCLFDGVNTASEINQSPKSGAIKASRNHRFTVEHSIFKNIKSSHGVWLDQSNYNCVFASNFMEDIEGSALFFEISHDLMMVNNLILRQGLGANTVRCSGSSGVKAVNNTIVGGQYLLYVITELRSAQYAPPRYLAEHTARYGSGGGYPPSGTNGTPTDHDKARPGAYAPSGKTNQTPGMNWQAEAEWVLNNVFVHTLNAGAATFYRARSSDNSVIVPASTVMPKQGQWIDGNVYGTDYGVLGVIDVNIGEPGGVAEARSLTTWRNTLKGSHYNLTNPEAKSLYGTSGVWVNPTDGVPKQVLIDLHGTSAPAPDSAVLQKYISPSARNFGSMLALPEGT